MAENKEYDEIMQEITSGLTGDKKKDFQYLQEKGEQYKEHKYGKEILRAIGRLISSLLPEDALKEINKMIGNTDLGIQSTLQEVQFNQYKKNYDKAIELIEPLIKKIEGAQLFIDDAVSEYHCFDNIFEEILYKYHNKPKKDVRRADLPLATVYTQYGSSLIDVERWEDARKALKEALHWNPASAEIMFEYAEIYKHSGELEDYFNLTIESFKYCYESKTVARAYRNLGWYFIEKELYEDAMIAYIMSMQYEQNSIVQGELFYITQKTGKEYDNPTVEEIRTCAEKYCFPVGAHEDVVGLAYSLGKQAADEGEKEAAKFFLGILYELTEDEKIKKLIDSLGV